MTWTYKPHLNLMIQIQFCVKKVRVKGGARGEGGVGLGDSLKSN